jgi:uncharacterized protein involved in exopolysaccharide biosynthesis
MANSNEVSLPSLAASLSNQRFKVALTFLVLSLLTIVVFLAVPREYGSEGKIFVQLGRGSVSLDPSATTSGTISLNESRETEIKSIVEVMRSREMAGAVVDEIGPERILESRWELPSFSLSKLTAFFKSESEEADSLPPAEYERLQKRDLAIKKVQDNIEIDAEKKTTVIYVWATAQSPKLAQKIAQSYLDNYERMHLDVNSTDHSFDFFDKQFAAQETAVNDALTAIKNFRNENEFLSIGGARNLLQTKIDSLQLEIQRTESQIDATQARLAEYEHQLSAMNENVELRSIRKPSTSAELMKDKVSQLKINRLSLVSTLPPGHTKVVSIDEQIAEAERLYSEMKLSDQELTTEINPNYLAMKVAKINEGATLVGLRESLVSLKLKYNETIASLKDLNSKELIADSLQRDVDVKTSAFQVYASKRAEAEVLRELNRQSISNVKVWQPAQLILKHVSPRGGVLLPLGIAFALLTATMVGLIAESRKRKKLEVREIEERIDLPVLVEIPRMASSLTLLN